MRLALAVLAFAAFAGTTCLLVYIITSKIEIAAAWAALVGATMRETGGWVSQIFNFEFGSSKGSKEKSEGLMGRLL